MNCHVAGARLLRRSANVGHRRRLVKRCAVMGMSLPLLITGCGGSHESAVAERPESVETSRPVLPESSTSSMLPPVVDSTVVATTETAAPSAPIELDCATPDVDLIVLGNSTESSVGVVDPALMWPNILEEQLGSSLVVGLDVIDMAVPGSTIIRPSPWNPGDTEPRFRLATHVTTVIDSVPAEARSQKIVLLHPSFIELQDTSVGDTFAVERAVYGIAISVEALEAAGFEVIVLGMRPITKVADDLGLAYGGISVGSRINRTNELLIASGFLPVGYTPPLMGADGYGDPRYYEDPNGNETTNGYLVDGLHQTPLGHAGVARAVGEDPRLAAALLAQCESVTG